MAAPATEAPSVVAFTGRNGDFRRLVTRGALLELVTFGFYRFWLTTDIRRHLWSHTAIAGDAFEYTGRGKELLFGFLVALTVLGPFFLAYFLIGLEFERFKAFASAPLYLLVVVFGQFAAYRARRYRLTRTVWRGVRFWMSGSGWAYAARSLLWGLLLLPTLGFAYPWWMAALERYKLRNTLYGDLRGRFDGTGQQLFKEIWWVWLLGIMPFVLTFGGIIAAVAVKATQQHAGPFPETFGGAGAGATQPPAVVAAGMAIIFGGIGFIGLPFLHAVRRAKEWAWWARGLRFGDLRVACYLPASSLFDVYWKMIGLWFAVFTIYTAIAGVLTIALHLHTAGSPLAAAMRGQLPIWGAVAYAIMYLLLLVAAGVIMRIYSLQRVWQRVANSCAVINLAAADNVGATSGNVVSALGEGLADGLDFGF